MGSYGAASSGARGVGEEAEREGGRGMPPQGAAEEGGGCKSACTCWIRTRSLTLPLPTGTREAQAQGVAGCAGHPPSPRPGVDLRAPSCQEDVKEGGSIRLSYILVHCLTCCFTFARLQGRRANMRDPCSEVETRLDPARTALALLRSPRRLRFDSLSPDQRRI